MHQYFVEEVAQTEAQRKAGALSTNVPLERSYAVVGLYLITIFMPNTGWIGTFLA